MKGMNRSLDDDFRTALDMIEAASVILLAIPKTPDADSLGCLYAMKDFLEKRGKEVFFFSPEPMPKRGLLVDIFPEIEKIPLSLPGITPDLIIIFDYGQAERICLPESFVVKKIVGFDHHKLSRLQPYAGLEVIDESAASATILLYRFLRYANFPISPEVATYVFVGLYTDTGSFSNPAVNAEAFSIAAELVNLGADLDRLRKSSTSRLTTRELAILQRAYSKILIDYELRFSYVVFSQEDVQAHQAVLADIMKIHGILRYVTDLEFAVILFEETNNQWIASLRRCPYGTIDLSELAAKVGGKFGGGGHEAAAGFSYRGEINQLLRDLKETVKKLKTSQRY